MAKTQKKSNIKKNTRNNKNKKQKVKKRKSSKCQSTYSPGILEAAVKAVSTGISFRKAAVTFGVPQTSIYRHVKHPDKLTKKGPSCVLTDKEESDIVDWIFYRAERGFPVDKEELLDTVQVYVKSLKKQTVFNDGRPGRHWYEAFYKRHPELRERVPQNLTQVRADVSECDLREWFAEIKTYLEKKNLLDIAPSRIYNCDETNIQLCPKSGKVITCRGARTVYKIVDALEKESVTGLFTYNAEGTRAPPMILYKYAEGIPVSVVQHVPAEWGIGNSETGWMTTETFFEYTTNVFYPWLVKNKIELPVLLYLDGHSSHVTMPLVTFCRSHGIELLSLFPHSTHVIQPLDVAFFHAFKEVWKKTVPLWKKSTNNTRLSKVQFAAVLLQALESMNEEKIIKNGFRTCGLFPFDPNAVQYDILNKKKKWTSNATETQAKGNCESVDRSNDSSDFDSSFLLDFESKLPVDLLQKFKESKIEGAWTADTENSGLFDFWMKLTNNDKIVRNKPRIISTEVLHDKIVVIDPSHTQPDVNLEDNSSKFPAAIEVIVDSDLNLDLTGEQDLLIVTEPQKNVDNLNSDYLQHLNEAMIVIVSDDNIHFQTVNPTSNQSVSNQEKSVQEKSTISDETTHSHTMAATSLVSKPSQAKETVFHELQGNEEKCQASCKENNANGLNQFLTLPEQYLPKKKKEKLKPGKKRISAVGTSEEWYKMHLEKENEKKLKEQKSAEKKKLQEQKKLLADKKKELDLQMKEIHKKIKEEQH